MTNLSFKHDHNILGCHASPSNECLSRPRCSADPSQAGYTLVALLALMTILALLAMAIAPRMQQQAEREREKEAIFRGEEVADAIRDYYKYRVARNGVNGDQALPTSMDQLLEGLPIPGGAKTRQILRASAAHDPLTIEGEWRFVHPRTEALVNFQQSVMAYAGNVLPTTQDRQMTQLQAFAVPPITNVVNLDGTSKSSSSSSSPDDSSGPFVGVASRSKRSSVLTFYGIEKHDEWIFTPLFRGP
jgi:type II secretory pathway pseudopilin PulG